MARAVPKNKAPAKPAAPSGGHRLWAPWRYTYLRNARASRQSCIFCFGAIDAAERRERMVLQLTRGSIVMLNAYPYNNGHVMVAPRRHVASPELLERRERGELHELISRTIVLLRKSLNPEGFNVGANLGRVAGAGFADHMHWHIVPRWGGDNNFMPTLASTRVLSQSLQDSFDQLYPLFKAVKAGLS